MQRGRAAAAGAEKRDTALGAREADDAMGGVLSMCPARVAPGAEPSGGGGSRKKGGGRQGRCRELKTALRARKAGGAWGRTPTPMSSERSAGRRGSMPRAKYSPESAENGRCREKRAIPVPREGCARRRAEQRGREPKKARGVTGVDTEPPDQCQRPTKMERLTGERSCVIGK
ncbi:hypothetical protein B0H14DRAFT_2796792, partial [Mycena olivaceomarginata]